MAGWDKTIGSSQKQHPLMARSCSCCTSFVTGSQMYTGTTQTPDSFLPQPHADTGTHPCRAWNASQEWYLVLSGGLQVRSLGDAFRMLGYTWNAPHLAPALCQLVPLLLSQAHIGPLLWLQFILAYPALHLPVTPTVFFSLTHLVPYLSHPVLSCYISPPLLTLFPAFKPVY